MIEAGRMRSGTHLSNFNVYSLCTRHHHLTPYASDLNVGRMAW